MTKNNNITEENKIDISTILFPAEKTLSFKYKDLNVTFKYSEPTIEKELLISAKRKALAQAFNIPISELNSTNSDYSDEIILINVISRLFYTVSDIKINGKDFPVQKLAEVKDVGFLYEFFRAITEATA